MDITLIKASSKGADYLLSKRFIQQIESLGSHVKDMATDGIGEACETSMEKELIPFVLGEDNAVCLESTEVSLNKYDNLGIVWFGAAPDKTLDAIKEKCDKVILVGTKNSTLAAAQLLKSIAEKHIRNLHVCLDVDILDPEYAPGVGRKVSSGLSPETLYRLLRVVMATGMVRSIDLVGYSPENDTNDITVASIMSALYGIFG